MPLRHTCFISHRHGQHDLMKRFVREFMEALCAEMEMQIRPAGVYLDQEQIEGGDFFNESLARNLFESACLIMVYTPAYFDPENTFCTREFLAMESLERDRLRMLGKASDRNHGLIVPVVLRGARQLPEFIRLSRHHYSFENFLLGGRRLSYHPLFAPSMRDLATYIADRFRELNALPLVRFEESGFRLPDETAAVDFLGRIGFAGRMPFPGRGDSYCEIPTS